MLKPVGAKSGKMLKPEGPKIDANGKSGKTNKRAKRIKSVKMVKW